MANDSFKEDSFKEDSSEDSFIEDSFVAEEPVKKKVQSVFYPEQAALSTEYTPIVKPQTSTSVSVTPKSVSSQTGVVKPAEKPKLPKQEYTPIVKPMSYGEALSTKAEWTNTINLTSEERLKKLKEASETVFPTLPMEGKVAEAAKQNEIDFTLWYNQAAKDKQNFLQSESNIKELNTYLGNPKYDQNKVKQVLDEENKKYKEYDAKVKQNTAELPQRKQLVDFSKSEAERFNKPGKEEWTLEGEAAGVLGGFNKSFSDMTFKPIVGATKVITNLLGIKTETSFERLANYYDKYAERNQPQTLTGQVVSGVTSAIPLIAVTSLTGGQPLPLVIGTQKGLNNVAEGKDFSEGALEGAKEGLAIEAMGMVGRSFGEAISKQYNLAAIPSKVATAVGMGGAFSIPDITKSAIDSQSFQGVNSHEALQSFLTGVAFEAAPFYSAVKEAIKEKKYDIAQKLQELDVYNTIFQSPNEVIKDIAESPVSSQELYAKAIELSKKENPTKEDKIAFQTMTRAAGGKQLIDQIAANPEYAINEINTADLTPQQKSLFIDRVNAIDDMFNADKQEANDLAEEIKTNTEKLNSIPENSVDPIDEARNEAKRNELKKRLGESKNKLQQIFNSRQQKTDYEYTLEPPILKKFSSYSNEKYGTVNRNDGKGLITLTKEEFLNEQANLQQRMGKGAKSTATGTEAEKVITPTGEEVTQTPVKKTEEQPQAGSVDVGGDKIKLDPDLANIDPILIAARNGDVAAQKQFEEMGLDWKQTTTYRFVGQSEVDVLLSNKKVESKRGMADAGIDVTSSPKVTTAATGEYRVTFKESFDKNNGLGKVRKKNEEDSNLERGRGYDINDVAKIERIDEKGKVVEVVYEQPLKEQPQAEAKEEVKDIQLSGLRDGFQASTRNAFDIRSDQSVMENINNDKSFTTTISRNGKEFIVVGLKIKQNIGAKTSGRDGYSFATIEKRDNLPANINEILTEKAKENAKNLYPNIPNIEFKEQKSEAKEQSLKETPKAGSVGVVDVKKEYTPKERREGFNNIADDNANPFEKLKQFFSGITKSDGGKGVSKYHGMEAGNGEMVNVRVSDHTGNYEPTGQYVVSIVADKDMFGDNLKVEHGENYTEIRINPNSKEVKNNFDDYVNEIIDHIEELKPDKQSLKETPKAGSVGVGGNVARKAMSKEIDSQVSAKENELIEKQKQDIEKAKKDLEAINSGDKSVIDEYVKKSRYKLVTKEVIANNPKSELLKKSEGKYYLSTGASIQVKTAEQIAVDGASKKANSKPTGNKAGNNQYVDAYNAITKFSEGKITAEEAKSIIEKAGLKIPKAVEQSLKETPQATENEKEPTKTEDGKPLSEGVQGVRTQGETGEKSAELRTEEEVEAPEITIEKEKEKPEPKAEAKKPAEIPQTKEERLSKLREKAKQSKAGKAISSAVGAVVSKAKEAINWAKQKEGVKEVKISARNPVVTQAAKDLKEGRITSEEYRAVVSSNSPIAPVTQFFDPATGQQVLNSVDANKKQNANKPIEEDRKVALRIDIPAFRNNNIWVISVHDGLKKLGDIMSYKNVARITDVVFGTQSPKSSLEIAAGAAKTSSVGRIFGNWKNFEGETEEQKGENAKQLVNEIANDPSWVQVGMNPFRHSYFYDRSNDLGRPVLSADEVVQIGGLVYAKNVKYGDWNSEAFRVKGMLDKAGKPVYFSKKPKEKIIASKEEIENEIVDAMNDMELVNEGIDLSEATTKQKIDVDELNSRLDTPLKAIDWEDYEGIPFGFTISDQLRSGDVKNTYTGETIGDLKGGIGFNGTEGNQDKAWANTTKEESDSMHEKANSIYENNKPLFEKLWAEGRIPEGVIPFGVVKMGETSIVSNEAVFRVGLQNIETLPKKNREAAVVELKKELTRKIAKELSDLKRGTVVIENKKTGEIIDTKKPYASNTLKTKKKITEQYKKILDIVNKKEYKDILEVLKNRTDFSLPEKALIAGEIFYGSPTPIGGKEINIERSRPGTPVSLALIGDKSPALINIAKITDMLTEPSMKDVPNMHIVSIVGVKVAEKSNGKWIPAGGSVKTNHPHYKFGTEGQSIGVLKQPVHMKDAFGEAYGNTMSQIVKNEAEGASIKPQAALSQGIPVSSGLSNRTFISAIGRKALDNVDKLSGFLRQVFPSTTFFTSQEAWEQAMADPEITKKLKDGDVIYAFTKDGNIFINPNLKTTKAALHETGHIWMDFMKDNKPELWQKGLSLVEGTKELKDAIAQYGDNELAREEALMEIISSKGENIVNAAQKAKIKEWLLSVWKYISSRFKSLQGLSPEEVQDLTLDRFVEGVLSDILSGRELVAEKVKGKGKAKFSILGQTAAERIKNSTKTLDDLKIAKQMEASDKSPIEIKRATGWEKGVDGQWRFEILPGKLKDFDINSLPKDKNGNPTAKLKDIYDAPELYEAYKDKNFSIKYKTEFGSELERFPKFKTNLENIDVVFDKYYEDGRGEYNDKDQIITLSGQSKNVLPTLLHEIQHAIQDREGFHQGGSPESAAFDVQYKIGRLKESIEEAQKNYDNALEYVKNDTDYINEKKSELEAEKQKLDKFLSSTSNIKNIKSISDKLKEALDKVSKAEGRKRRIYIDDFYLLAEEEGLSEQKIEALIDASDRLDSFELYKKIAGEVEARNVEARQSMTAEERRNKLLSETEDVAREDQLILEYPNGERISKSQKAPEDSTAEFVKSSLEEGYTDEEISTILEDDYGYSKDEVKELINNAKITIKNKTEINKYIEDGTITQQQAEDFINSKEPIRELTDTPEGTTVGAEGGAETTDGKTEELPTTEAGEGKDREGDFEGDNEVDKDLLSKFDEINKLSELSEKEFGKKEKERFRELISSDEMVKDVHYNWKNITDKLIELGELRKSKECP